MVLWEYVLRWLSSMQHWKGHGISGHYSHEEELYMLTDVVPLHQFKHQKPTSNAQGDTQYGWRRYWRDYWRVRDVDLGPFWPLSRLMSYVDNGTTCGTITRGIVWYRSGRPLVPTAVKWHRHLLSCNDHSSYYYLEILIRGWDRDFLVFISCIPCHFADDSGSIGLNKKFFVEKTNSKVVEEVKI